VFVNNSADITICKYFLRFHCTVAVFASLLILQGAVVGWRMCCQLHSRYWCIVVNIYGWL